MMTASSWEEGCPREQADPCKGVPAVWTAAGRANDSEPSRAAEGGQPRTLLGTFKSPRDSMLGLSTPSAIWPLVSPDELL